MNPRVAAMAARIRNGETLRAVGEDYGITRERVRQLVKLAGVSGRDGRRVRAEVSRAEFVAARDQRYLARHGCTYAQYRAVVRRGESMEPGYERTPMGAYQRQRHNAAVRGIEWRFPNFWSWWQVWEKSGRWAERGRGRGYVMSRFGDVGPYSPENVHIISATENVAEYYDHE